MKSEYSNVHNVDRKAARVNSTVVDSREPGHSSEDACPRGLYARGKSYIYIDSSNVNMAESNATGREMDPCNNFACLGRNNQIRNRIT